MGEVMSQAEIDELLRQMAGNKSGEAVIAVPEAQKKEAHKYDFENPNKFNREQLRTLENIFDNYARAVSSFLTAYLRTPTQLEVTHSEQIMYRDFNAALSNPVILAMLELLPLKGSIIIDISTNIGYAIIDRILGGPGFGLKKLRDFSEIEKILLERIITQMVSYLPESWENILAIKPRLDKIETNSQFAQIIGPTEKVALVVLNIKIGSTEGLINICLPYLVMEPIMDKLYTRFWYLQHEEEDKENYRTTMEDDLESVNVTVTAVIGKTSIMVRDFLGLQAGDIIKLDSYISSDLSVMVGSMLKFHAKPGINRGKNAIQITSLVEKGDL